MDEIFPAGEAIDEASIERCHELLGDEAKVAASERRTRNGFIRDGPVVRLNDVGRRIQPLRINHLELVAQIFTSWNPLMGWIQEIDRFRCAA